jgi:hypothetical protein
MNTGRWTPEYLTYCLHRESNDPITLAALLHENERAVHPRLEALTGIRFRVNDYTITVTPYETNGPIELSPEQLLVPTSTWGAIATSRCSSRQSM